MRDLSVIRANEIAKKHGESWPAFSRKAARVGFNVGRASNTIDKITAEALEVAIYGFALASKLPSSEEMTLARERRALQELARMLPLFEAAATQLPRGGEFSGAKIRLWRIAALLKSLAVALEKHAPPASLTRRASELADWLDASMRRDSRTPDIHVKWNVRFFPRNT